LKGCICVVAVFVIACGSGSVSGVSRAPTSTPTTSSSALVVYTTWVPDAKVTNGPEPGYKPALTGLTGPDIQRATTAIDMTGTSWVLNISFTPRGANLFAKLTRDNVTACTGGPATAPNGNCPQRHLGIWLDLTQADTDHWEDPTYAEGVSRPYDLSCLRKFSSTEVCAKLISNPITLQEIDGGNATMAGAFTQQSANELATAINSTSHS